MLLFKVKPLRRLHLQQLDLDHSVFCTVDVTSERSMTSVDWLIEEYSFAHAHTYTLAGATFRPLHKSG